MKRKEEIKGNCSGGRNSCFMELPYSSPYRFKTGEQAALKSDLKDISWFLETWCLWLLGCFRRAHSVANLYNPLLPLSVKNTG
jgi:hypothetical protein